MALFKPPKRRDPGLFYPPNQAQELFERVSIGIGQNCAKEFNNLDNSKKIIEPVQPLTIDTVNMRAGNGENILYIW